MLVGIKDHGIEKYQMVARLYLEKCAIGLGIEVTNNLMSQLAEDLIEKYQHDSIEDIIQALRKGRQGHYGSTYGKLNMIIISDWMSKHLEEKARAREQRENEYNSNEGPEFKSLKEYHEWVKQGFKNQKELEKPKEGEKEFQKFRLNHIRQQAKKDPGFLVRTKDGKVGRTFKSKEPVNGKIPVFIATEFHEKLKTPISFEKTGILCDPRNLKNIGFID